MYRTLCVMALVALYAGLAHSFSWEIVTGVGKRLEFLDINGTVTHTVNMTIDIYFLSYDPVHSRVLFADFDDIYSFDIAKQKTECLFNTTNGFITGLAYDPPTELLLWAEGGEKMNSISLKPEINRKDSEKHFIWSEDYFHNIVADSCGGFLYGMGTFHIHRARFNGSERQVAYNNTYYLNSVTFDQREPQKMYFAGKGGIKSADRNGNNVTTIFRSTKDSYYLAVSKEFIYWRAYNVENKKYCIWQIPKTPRGIDVEPKLFIERYEYISEIVANYNIEDITPENQICDTLKSLLPNYSVSTDVPTVY